MGTPGCRFCEWAKGMCLECQRHQAWGVIVDALTDDGYALDALDAVADLMTERVRLLRQHQKELREEAREAQRSATDAYHEGHADGRHERDAW
jgi:hypothetical protein